MAQVSKEKDTSRFIPLRKKAKLDGIEGNYVHSVYEKSFKGDRMSESDVERFRWYNGIEVKGNRWWFK